MSDSLLACDADVPLPSFAPPPRCADCVHHATVPQGDSIRHACALASLRSCMAERMDDGRCGPEGLLFRRASR